MRKSTIVATAVAVASAAVAMSAGAAIPVYFSPAEGDPVAPAERLRAGGEYIPGGLKLAGIMSPTPWRYLDYPPGTIPDECQDVPLHLPGILLFLKIRPDAPPGVSGTAVAGVIGSQRVCVVAFATPDKVAEAIAQGIAVTTLEPPGPNHWAPPFTSEQLAVLTTLSASAPPAPALLLLDRFRVEVGVSPPGEAPRAAVLSPLTNRAGTAWFFNEQNIEMLVKMQNACVPPFNRYWVFFAATTNVEFEVSVTDTESSETMTYSNPQGMVALPVADTETFATCP